MISDVSVNAVAGQGDGARATTASRRAAGTPAVAQVEIDIVLRRNGAVMTNTNETETISTNGMLGKPEIAAGGRDGTTYNHLMTRQGRC